MSHFQLRSGNNAPFKMLGSSPFNWIGARPSTSVAVEPSFEDQEFKNYGENEGETYGIQPWQKIDPAGNMKNRKQNVQSWKYDGSGGPGGMEMAEADTMSVSRGGGRGGVAPAMAGGVDMGTNTLGGPMEENIAYG
tara:strand:- start:292 stop:699 length:408 start_codon:yes stop_codon:yes gene_type:complete